MSHFFLGNSAHLQSGRLQIEMNGHLFKLAVNLCSNQTSFFFVRSFVVFVSIKEHKGNRAYIIKMHATDKAHEMNGVHSISDVVSVDTIRKSFSQFHLLEAIDAEQMVEEKKTPIKF